MAKPKTSTVRFVDELPPRNQWNPWADRLTPLLSAPRRWAEVYIAENSDKARDAVSNLNRRKVQIPNPDHEWKFASRGHLVFAMYGGPGAKKAGKQDAA